jgi:hypothetical protein
MEPDPFSFAGISRHGVKSLGHRALSGSSRGSWRAPCCMTTLNFGHQMAIEHSFHLQCQIVGIWQGPQSWATCGLVVKREHTFVPCACTSLLMGIWGHMQELWWVWSGALGEIDNLVTMQDVLDAQHVDDTTKDETYLCHVIMPLEVLQYTLISSWKQ